MGAHMNARDTKNFCIPQDIESNTIFKLVNTSFIIQILRIIKMKFGLNFNFKYQISYKDGTKLFANIYTHSFQRPYQDWVNKIKLENLMRMADTYIKHQLFHLWVHGILK